MKCCFYYLSHFCDKQSSCTQFFSSLHLRIILKTFQTRIIGSLFKKHDRNLITNMTVASYYIGNINSSVTMNSSAKSLENLFTEKQTYKRQQISHLIFLEQCYQLAWTKIFVFISEMQKWKRKMHHKVETMQFCCSEFWRNNSFLKRTMLELFLHFKQFEYSFLWKWYFVMLTSF